MYDSIATHIHWWNILHKCTNVILLYMSNLKNNNIYIGKWLEQELDIVNY